MIELRKGEDGTVYSQHEITLHAVPNGNVRKRAISVEEFSDDGGMAPGVPSSFTSSPLSCSVTIAWPIKIGPSTCGAFQSRRHRTPRSHMKEEFKRKLVHELKELLSVFLFLAPFFTAFATYRMLLLDEFGLGYFTYGSALVSALVLSKVILVGEYAHLGRRHEGSLLIVSTLYKSLAFGLLAGVFHILEEGIKDLVFLKTSFHPVAGRNIDEWLAHALVTFCAFVPFFAFRETARVLGEGKLYELFFHGRGATESWVFTKPAAQAGQKKQQPSL